MKQVKFIEIKSELGGWGGFKGSKYTFPNINETIEEMIKKVGNIVDMFQIQREEKAILKLYH